MKNREIIREALISNTIRLIGSGGFEKATTKAIVSEGIADPNIRLNEVYIYRLFGSKDLLYAEVFSILDNELFGVVRMFLKDFDDSYLPFREKLHRFFNSMWGFLLSNEWRCRAYVRYYYSAYFCGRSLCEHRKLLYEQEDFFAAIFKDESDVISLIHTTFMTMMDFAIRVYNGDLENAEENAYHIFNLLYNSLSPYFDPVVLEGRRKTNNAS